MYTIGQVSKMFNLPISTLRYYDNEGLFPNIARSSGIRKFSDHEDIKQFIQWCNEGSSTYVKRRQLFESRKLAVEEEISKLQKTLDMLKFKCWYYDKAIEDGNEDGIHAMLPDKLPEDIQKLYDNSHSD